MTLWMAVTTDKLELPIAVADTQIGLARILGMSDSSIRKLILYYADGKNKNKSRNSPYVKVKIKEQDDNVKPNSCRPLTETSVYFIHKYYAEGMTISEISELLCRPYQQVCEALKESLTGTDKVRLKRYLKG